MNPETPLLPCLAERAMATGQAHLRVLDVGAGPVTSIGYVPPPGITMEIVATAPSQPRLRLCPDGWRAKTLEVGAYIA
jgi:hypothetical protein